MAVKNYFVKIHSNLLPLILLFLLLFVSISYSRIYYINSESGNDNNSGFSSSQAWKTISKINKSVFNPGDEILFSAGGIWREELIIPSSGTEKNPIKFGSYGEGNIPRILGSEKVVSWENVSGSVWKTSTNTIPGWVWFIKNDNKIVWGKKQGRFENLIKEDDFFIDSTKIFIFSNKNPNTIHNSIEYSVRDFGIISGWYDHAKDFIIISNLEIAFTKNANVRAVNAEGWKISNIISHHSGANDETDGQGIQFEGMNSFFSRNTLYENGQHGFYLSSAGHGIVENNVIEQNKIYNNYHTGIDIMNHGGNKNSHRNTIIRQNLVFDTFDFTGNEVGIQTYGIDSGMVKNVAIHNNIISNINGIGISAVPNSDSIFICNNTVYETKSSCINIDNDNKYSVVINNIGINNNYYAVLFLKNTLNKVVDYNIWFTDSLSDTKLVFIKDKYFENQKRYSNSTKFDLHGSDFDPMLIIKDGIPVGIKSESKCIDKGKDTVYSYDYYNNPIIGETDIGAIEYQK